MNIKKRLILSLKHINNLYKDFKKREISDNEKLEGYSNKIEKYNKRFSFLEETVQEDLRDIQEVLIQIKRNLSCQSQDRGRKVQK